MGATAAAGCDGGGGPAGLSNPVMAFVPASIDLGGSSTAEVRLENRGADPAGPIQLVPGPITRGDSAVAGVRIQVMPALLSGLDPGASATVQLSRVLDGQLLAGTYQTNVEARLGGLPVEVLDIAFSVSPPAPPGGGISVTLSGPGAPRQGDVVLYRADVRDSTGAPVTDSTLVWSVDPASAGLVKEDGRFVGYAPGVARLVASIASAADTMEISIEPRGLAGSFSVIAHAPVTERFTSDLWVHGLHAYTGTWGCRAGLCGDRILVWDVSDPGIPRLSDELVVDARTVNDVKVRSDGALAVITHEGSEDGRNGISLLDLSDPGQPSLITRFTDGLERGVHNVWIDGDYVYTAVDGGGQGLHVVDISDPTRPRTVAQYYAGSSILHDVYVRDGLAFLSHWNAGMVILDVGNGMAGGSPSNPIEISRIATAGGQTHNTWYWPQAGYVFVGEEDFTTPGVLHVVDVTDLTSPEEVATLGLPDATPHNFWLDEDRAILYVGWYENGLRAVDVTGVLLGSLERQGREIAALQYGDGADCSGGSATCTWAPQLHEGLVYLSDLNSGLWILRPDF